MSDDRIEEATLVPLCDPRKQKESTEGDANQLFV